MAQVAKDFGVSPGLLTDNQTRGNPSHGCRSESLFTRCATHSRWEVIGKTPTVLSVNAILCGRLRSGGETGL